MKTLISRWTDNTRNAKEEQWMGPQGDVNFGCFASDGADRNDSSCRFCDYVPRDNEQSASPNALQRRLNEEWMAVFVYKTWKKWLDDDEHSLWATIDHVTQKMTMTNISLQHPQLFYNSHASNPRLLSSMTWRNERTCPYHLKWDPSWFFLSTVKQDIFTRFQNNYETFTSKHPRDQ